MWMRDDMISERGEESDTLFFLALGSSGGQFAFIPRFLLLLLLLLLLLWGFRSRGSRVIQ
jgi:hypothetical protein